MPIEFHVIDFLTIIIFEKYKGNLPLIVAYLRVVTVYKVECHGRRLSVPRSINPIFTS